MQNGFSISWNLYQPVLLIEDGHSHITMEIIGSNDVHTTHVLQPQDIGALVCLSLISRRHAINA